MSKLLASSAARTAAVAFGSAAAVAVAASAASATTLLAGGVAVPAGTTVAGPLSGTATLVTPNGTVSCTGGRLAGTAGSSGGLVVGVALTQFDLGAAVVAGSCTDTIAGVYFEKAQLSSTVPGNATYLSSGAAPNGRLSIPSPTFRVTVRPFSTGPSTTCDVVVTASFAIANANLVNSNNSATFSAVPATSTSTTGICSLFNATAGNPASTNFSAVFRPLSTTAGNVTIAP